VGDPDKGRVHMDPIQLNPTPGSVWTAYTRQITPIFSDRLETAGIPTDSGGTRGMEIDGICGQSWQ